MSQDGLKLLGMIWRIVCVVEEHLQDTWEMFEYDKLLQKFCHNMNINNDKYKTQFEAYTTSLESYGRCVPIYLDLLTSKVKAIKVDDMEKSVETEKTKAEEEVK